MCVAPHLYELYFRDDLMGDGRFGKGDGSVMLLHPGCSSNNNNVLASRGGKRAQKKPNNPKSWGAEQTIMCGRDHNVRPLNRYSCFKTYSEKTGATAQRPFHKRHQQK